MIRLIYLNLLCVARDWLKPAAGVLEVEGRVRQSALQCHDDFLGRALDVNVDLVVDGFPAVVLSGSDDPAPDSTFFCDGDHSSVA